MRSTVHAENSITFGPDAAMSIGTAGWHARSSHWSRLGSTVQLDRAPLQVGVQLFGAGEEVGERHRLAAEMEQRGVATAETERDPPAALLLHGRGDGRERLLGGASRDSSPRS